MWWGSSSLLAPYPKLVNASSFPLISFFLSFFFLVNNSPFYVCSIVCLSSHLLKDIFVFQLLVNMNISSVNICMQVLCEHQ